MAKKIKLFKCLMCIERLSDPDGYYVTADYYKSGVDAEEQEGTRFVKKLRSHKIETTIRGR